MNPNWDWKSLAHDSSGWVFNACEAPLDVQYDLSICQSVSISKSREGWSGDHELGRVRAQRVYIASEWQKQARSLRECGPDFNEKATETSNHSNCSIEAQHCQYR